MNIAEHGTAEMDTARQGIHATSAGRAFPPQLGIDRFVENLSSTLLKTGAGKVDVTMQDRAVRLAVEEDKIDWAFTALSNAIPRGAEVTIFGHLLRIQTDEAEEDTGCALLSVSVAGGKRVAKRVLRDALFGIRKVIKTQSGFLRFWEGQGKMRLNLYLPVIHGAGQAS